MRTRGFSLIEIVITVFIIVLMFSVAAVALISAKGTSDEALQNIALRIASTKLEALRAGGYDALPADGTFADAQLALLPSAEASTTASDYADEVKEVSVSIEWQEPSGPRSLSLTTLVAQTGGIQP